MLFLRTCAFLILFLKYPLNVSFAKEPMCSKFAYDEQLLEKMIRQEINVEMMQTDIQKTQETVSDTLEKIKKTDEDVYLTLESLTNNFTNIVARIAKVKEKTEAEVSQTLASLQLNLTEVVERIIQEKEKNEEVLRQKFEELRFNITKESEDQIETLKLLSESLKKPSVAFFAHNVVDLQLDRTDKIIVFDTATTNEGSGYDTSTGIFTAPVGGLYQFIVNYCTYLGQHSPLALVLSGNVIARSSNDDKDYHTCHSFPANIRVESGEKVWVKCYYGSSGYSLYQNGWLMNSFSGLLINK